MLANNPNFISRESKNGRGASNPLYQAYANFVRDTKKTAEAYKTSELSEKYKVDEGKRTGIGAVPMTFKEVYDRNKAAAESESPEALSESDLEGVYDATTQEWEDMAPETGASERPKGQKKAETLVSERWTGLMSVEVSKKLANSVTGTSGENSDPPPFALLT